MSMSPRTSFAAALVACLTLSACDEAPKGAGAPGDMTTFNNDAPTPEDIAAAKAAAKIVYCARNKQHVSRTECKRLNEIWDNLATGKAAIDAPAEMVRDTPSTVSFAIAGDDSGTTVGEILGSDATPVTQTVKIGGTMAASLTGRGFKIEPAGTVRKEIGPAGTMLWEWQVTPLKGHDDRLRVEAFVIVPGPNGTQQESPLRNFTKDVRVKVTSGQRVADLMDESSSWLQRGNNWLKTLAGFLTALGAVFVAIKALRPKPKSAPPV
jgi:hypothetical protein